MSTNCPCCNANLNTAALGCKQSFVKSSGIKLFRKKSQVCPYCNEEIKTRINQWYYIPQLPLLYYLYAVASKQYDLIFPLSIIDWLIVGAAIVSMVLQFNSKTYEKA